MGFGQIQLHPGHGQRVDAAVEMVEVGVESGAVGLGRLAQVV